MQNDPPIGKKLTDEEYARTLEVWERHGRNNTRAARELELTATAVRNRVEQAKRREISASEPAPEISPALVLPRFPSGRRKIRKILDYLRDGYTSAEELKSAQRWFEVKIKADEPIGICWFGDPHLGDPGTNYDLLERDIAIVTKTPGIYGANIGDTTNNWGGSLLRLYAEQDVSRETERELAKWFLQDAGIPWLLWLKGNHDTMADGFSVYLDTICATQVPLIEWRAKFKMVFPNGRYYRIDAAHDYKGHSLWNEMHGPDRASIVEEHADFFIAGHKHTWGTKQKELPTGRVATLLRVAGYKKIDSYATRHQYDSKNYGSAGLIILDPGERFHPAFADLEAGAEYLRWLRKRR